MHRHPWRNATRTLGLGLAASLTLAPLALLPQAADASSGTSTGTATVSASGSPLKLWAPKRVTAYTYGSKRVWTDLGLRVIAQGSPFELWSTRADTYDGPITTVWRSADGDQTLTPGLMKSFNGLAHFIHVTMTPVKGGEARTLDKTACLSGWSERVQPEAAATSAYPKSCWYNPFTLGSVQGIEAGWATPILGQTRPMKLPLGKYDVTASIGQKYVDAFGLDPADASTSFRLVVDAGDGGKYRTSTRQHARRTSGGRAGPATRTSRIARPAAHRPTGTAAAPADGPRPDLRPLPAWGIQVSRNGHFLQFAATVWNAGDSPLVVDGFRHGEENMDAYQYFFDGDGNQVGYQPVGSMEWDARPSHHHWHFEDFARYTLVTKDGAGDINEKVRSKKEAFCLANTDAVDLTVKDADWNPENTDLATSCGDLSSLSIREVLAAGWGDTYAQYRAGQSFRLTGLPSGKYFIAVTANPDGRLVESDTSNNQVLREVDLKRHKDGTYSVTVPQVGNIKESTRGF